MFLDSTVTLSISLFVVMWVVIVVLIIIVWLRGDKQKEKYNQKYHEFEIELLKKDGFIREQDLTVQKLQTEMRGQAQDLAIKQFEEWKTTELLTYKKIIDKNSNDAALVALRQWIAENEERIRKDAANRRVRSVMGKVTEHLIPFSEAFSQFNPKDARFIGSPIDLIVFDGAEEKKDEITIYFLEIKTGTSALSQRQKKVMEAVKDKRVEWLKLIVKDFGDEVNASL